MSQSPTPVPQPEPEAIKTADPTPPFTQPVPNPPIGPVAERRVEDNLIAAEQRGDPKAAEGYAQQLEDPSTPLPGNENAGQPVPKADPGGDTPAPAPTADGNR